MYIQTCSLKIDDAVLNLLYFFLHIGPKFPYSIEFMSLNHSDNALITSPHGQGVIIIYGGEEMFELQFNLAAKTLKEARKTMKWVRIGNLPKPDCEIKAIVEI